MAKNLIQLNKGLKQYPGKVLFDEATFSINEGEHVGVIGPNGAGKSTLFKIITGADELDEGVLVKSRELRLAYLEQETKWSGTETIESFLEGRVKPMWELKKLAPDFGLTEDFSILISSLSGGYQMRVKLLGLIANEPNLMLLDEPTNYLDLETLLVLERFLQSYEGAFLLISHDREFLVRTTDHTLEVEGGEITKYSGNIEDYFEQKQLIAEQIEKQIQNQATKRKQILDFVNRFGAKATKAKQAQSKLKLLGKMSTIESKSLPIKAKIRISEPVRTGKISFQIEGANLGYGEKQVLTDINLTLLRGDHIGVVGFNGAGKSTLLKALAKKLVPLGGEVQLGSQVEVGYYAQHVANELNLNLTVFSELEREIHPEVTRQDILDMAGSLLFSGEDLQKKVSILSGGEKARVALGKILLKKCSVLILDEPTNHLDFHTVEALTQSLSGYSGTILTVSHDRSFIKRVSKKIIEIRDGRALFYAGSYEEYLWSLEKGSLSQLNQAEESFESKAETTVRVRSGQVKGSSLGKQLREAETMIKKCETQLEKLNLKLTQINEELVSNPQFSKETLEKLQEIQGQVQLTEKNWEEWVGKKEALESNS